MNYNFEWDFNKAKKNLLKHKISFEDACTIFKDENAISIFDDEHSENEDRWITIGIDVNTRTLVVVHTYITFNENNCIIRIISARKATKNEQKAYKGG
ncbi:BrnT family toxin [Arcobacter sp. FWKO B]|uniref:BrnT family toxin n=1 Tax=Arcobacter sp. FWKO B TaxID=2593672 RepID=UPI0018A5A1E6|nr:BrnT family toxin [Arcobacter sp. FWKO B]QOG13118.1 BrnT family toxin [Arcobacter sp. FWKO B]